jgi:phosphoglycolate phosphatase
MGFKLCIFDLDGTLIDTSGDITDAINDMRAFFNLDKMERDKVIDYVGDGIRKLVERCIHRQNVDLEEAVSFFEHAYRRRLVETTKPYPGIIKVLNQLEENSKAILTNKSYSFTEEIVRKLDLERYFPIIVAGDTLKRKKPFPDAVEHIIRQTDSRREATIMIGDGKNDVLTARNAGISCIYVTYGFGRLRMLGDLQPDYVIDRPEELLGICL